MPWNPEQYLKFAELRLRPAVICSRALTRQILPACLISVALPAT